MACLSPWKLPSWQRAAMVGLWICLASVSAAAQPEPAPEPAVASPPDPVLRQRFDHLQSATVGVRVRAVAEAASAQTLGRDREGTGIVIAPDGLVLTIGYLVLEADSVEIVTRDNKTIPGQVAAYDFVTGLGLVRPLFPLEGVQPVALGSALATPLGSPLLFMTGVSPRQAGAVRLTDTRPFTGNWEYHLDTALYTTPPVANHSGAGLFNFNGDLVGIGHLLLLDVMPDDNPNVVPGNLFVPVDVLRPVIDELLRTGNHPQAHRPWMGVNAVELDGRIRITRVAVDSPAQAAGVRPGHWVTAVDGQPVDSLEAFYKKVWSHAQAEGAIRLSVREGPAERVLDIPVRARIDAFAKPRGI